MVYGHGALFSSTCAFLVFKLVHEQQNHVKKLFMYIFLASNLMMNWPK